ncbi:MAG: T9SS type A sorting domain-containing protein [Chitinophagales bacterium]|nr:T9SS type A sorting domain-containing protein [Chitinophagales bacterium]
MKTYLTFLPAILLLFCSSSFAQLPYQSVLPDRTSYYEQPGYLFENGNLVYAFRADSIIVVGSDVIYIPYKQLNNSVPFCLGPNMFGDRILITSGMDQFIVGDDTFSILRNPVLDKKSNFHRYADGSYITIRFDSLHTEDVLGEADSVRHFSLRLYDSSNKYIQSKWDNEFITISKFHGAVQFLNLVDDESVSAGTYTLVGLTNPDIGFHLATAREIFDFDVNDEFQYSYHNSSGLQPVSEEYTDKKLLEKVSSTNGDSVFYTWKRIIVSYHFVNGYRTDTIVTQDTIQEIIVFNELSAVGDLPFTISKSFLNQGELSIHYVYDNSFCGKNIAEQAGLYGYDSVSGCLQGIIYFNLPDRNSFASGLGLVSSYASDYPYNGTGLTFYKKAADSCGSRINFSLLTNVEVVNAGIKIQIYPNPATDQLHIEAPSIHNATVIILNLLGQVVLKQQFSDNASIEISTLPKGMYLINITDKKGNVVQKGKVVKE